MHLPRLSWRYNSSGFLRKFLVAFWADTRDFVSCSPEVLPRRYDNTRLRLALLRSLALAHSSAFAFSLTRRDSPVFSLTHYDRCHYPHFLLVILRDLDIVGVVRTGMVSLLAVVVPR